MSDVPSHLRGGVDLSSLAQGSPQPTAAAGDGAGAPPQGYIVEGTDANFSQFLELSQRVPVVVDLWADWCGPCKQLSPVLEKVVTEHQGRLVLVTVDVDANPQLAQAFQAQSIPMVLALLGGRPLNLFNGALPEAQVREVFDQLLAAAEQNGITGTVAPAEESGAEAEPEAAPLPPHHAEALAAIDAGDLVTAKAEYNKALAENPGDDEATVGLARVHLLTRLAGKTPEVVRKAAADDPASVEAQFDVADLDVAGGHVDDAFDRLLDLFASAAGDDRESIRTRLLDLFDIVGSSDERVKAARRRLANLLY